jgi:hypothetical protein
MPQWGNSESALPVTCLLKVWPVDQQHQHPKGWLEMQDLRQNLHFTGIIRNPFEHWLWNPNEFFLLKKLFISCIMSQRWKARRPGSCSNRGSRVCQILRGQANGCSLKHPVSRGYTVPHRHKVLLGRHWTGHGRHVHFLLLHNKLSGLAQHPFISSQLWVRVWLVHLASLLGFAQG